MFDTKSRHHRAALLHLVAAQLWGVREKLQTSDAPILASLSAMEASEHAGRPTDDIAVFEPTALIVMHLAFANEHAR